MQRQRRERKILYIITKSNWGGAQRYVFDLATNLPKDRFEVAVACGGSGPLATKLQAAGIRAINVPGLERDINFIRERRSLFSLFKIFSREKPDIIHLNSSKAGGLGSAAAFAYKLLTFNFKLLTVFTAHGWAFNENRPRWQKGAIKILSWAASLFQDRIIVINRADWLAAKKFIPAKKLVLIYHGIKPRERLAREEARRFLAAKVGCPLGENALVVGTVAEHTKNKGLGHLIDAVNQMKSQITIFKSQTNSLPCRQAGNYQIPKFKTIIIGEGELRRELERQIQTLKLGDTVHLPGFVPDAERLLTAFDVFVLPSIKEGLPYVIMEAMAAGLPVVASAVGGVPDLITHRREGLLVKPASVRDLAEALLEVAGDEKTRQNLGNKAETKIDQYFRLENMIAKTEALYLGNPVRTEASRLPHESITSPSVMPHSGPERSQRCSNGVNSASA